MAAMFMDPAASALLEGSREVVLDEWTPFDACRRLSFLPALSRSSAVRPASGERAGGIDTAPTVRKPYFIPTRLEASHI